MTQPVTDGHHQCMENLLQKLALWSEKIILGRHASSLTGRCVWQVINETVTTTGSCLGCRGSAAFSIRVGL